MTTQTAEYYRAWRKRQAALRPVAYAAFRYGDLGAGEPILVAVGVARVTARK